MKTAMHLVGYNEIVEYEEHGPVIAVRMTTGLMQDVSSFFLSTRDWKRRKKAAFQTATELCAAHKTYMYLDRRFWKVFNKNGFARLDLQEAWENGHVDPFKALKRKTYDVSNIVRPDWSSHQMYALDEKYPSSVPIYVHWIGGVTAEFYDLDAAEKTLKESEHTWDVVRKEVNTYDPDRHYLEIIEYMTKIPPELHRKLCEYLEGLEHWTARLKEVAALKPWHLKAFESAIFDIDYLGLRECWKESEE